MKMSASDQFGNGNHAILPSAVDLDALIRGEHRDPFSMLGPHSDGAEGQVIRAYLPNALAVRVLARDGHRDLGELSMTEKPGFFAGHFPVREPYLLKITWATGEQITEDPYSFSEQLGEMDLYLFAEGN